MRLILFRASRCPLCPLWLNSVLGSQVRWASLRSTLRDPRGLFQAKYRTTAARRRYARLPAETTSEEFTQWYEEA